MPKPELTDDFHLDEPLAYLVKCHDTTVHEYFILLRDDEARSFAEAQEDLAEEDDGPEEFHVYPLYAGHPL